MYGIQETLNQTTEQLKTIENYMDRHGSFDPNEVSLTTGLKRSVEREVRESQERHPVRGSVGEDPRHLRGGALGS